MFKKNYLFILYSILLITILQTAFAKEYVTSEVQNSITYRTIHIDNDEETTKAPKLVKTDKKSLTFIEYKKKFKKEFGKYGEFYANSIAESEDIKIHFEYFMEIKNLYKDIQGCEFKNPALVLGLTAQEIFDKIIQPARRLADDLPCCIDTPTLIFIAMQEETDPNGAFDMFFNEPSFTVKEKNLHYFKCFFDESFLGHYDNIILCQPNNNQNANDTLNKFFIKLEHCLISPVIDITTIGHGVSNYGIILSRPNQQDFHSFDIFDFGLEKSNGQIYTSIIKKLFIKCIDNEVKQYYPKFIGIGCTSDFVQSCIDAIMPDFYKDKVKVFGSPFSTNGIAILGYNNGFLDFLVTVSSIVSNIGMLIRLTDDKFEKKNEQFVDSFIMTKQNNYYGIIDTYRKTGYSGGYLTKKNGVSMEYEAITYQ